MLRNRFIGSITRKKKAEPESKALIGWKYNFLTVDGNNHIQMLPLTSKLRVNVNADAVCNVLAEIEEYKDKSRSEAYWAKKFQKYHTLVGNFCSCGFYAYSLRESAEAHDQEKAGAALIQVAISGKFTQYKKGFRYAHQRVTEVIVGKCETGFTCDSQAVLFNKPYSYYNEGMLKPSCLKHASYVMSERMTFDTISSSISSQETMAAFSPVVVETANGDKPWVPDAQDFSSAQRENRMAKLFESEIPISFAVAGSAALFAGILLLLANTIYNGQFDSMLQNIFATLA